MGDFTKDEFIQFWGAKGYTETWDGYEKNWTPEIMNMITHHVRNNDTVLEIGCGSGYWTNRIYPLCSKMYAIDLIPRPALHKNIVYIEKNDCDYTCSTIEDESIDFVFSFGVFSHLSLSACDTYLQDIVRVLKPKGKALVMYADELGLQKHFRNPTLTCENVGWKYNTYQDTLSMVMKYPLLATKMLDYRDTLLLLNKVVE